MMSLHKYLNDVESAARTTVFGAAGAVTRCPGLGGLAIPTRTLGGYIRTNGKAQDIFQGGLKLTSVSQGGGKTALDVERAAGCVKRRRITIPPEFQELVTSAPGVFGIARFHKKLATPVAP
ncbi:MAG: hypothetical protein LAQ69_45100 [Acidobacteriia bacterium]|nr:hypothetical protein [Terriglobia bacterium]